MHAPHPVPHIARIGSSSETRERAQKAKESEWLGEKNSFDELNSSSWYIHYRARNLLLRQQNFFTPSATSKHSIPSSHRL